MAVVDLAAYLPTGIRDRIAPILTGNRRTVALAGTAVAAALALLVAVASSWESGYSVLFAGLSPEEGGRAIAELQKLNVPYRTGEDGRLIMVPKADLGTARLQLAMRGVPKQDGDHWALLDNQSLGVSPFVEQVHYVRAIESTLSSTIRGIEGVVSATVRLALPKQTDLLGDTPKPSASVIVRLQPGKQLTGAQVEGIAGLVAGSVPGLTRDNVTIVDQSGGMLSPSGRDPVQQVPRQLGIARDIGRRYEAMISKLLAPAVGPENFRVSVDVDLDFSQKKESSITYGGSHVLSQEETLQNRAGAAEAPIGIPGALSNRPPSTPTSGANAANNPDAQKPPEKAEAAPAPDTHKVTNYNIDRSVQAVERPSWQLASVHVVVLLNSASDKPLSPARIQSVKTLVGSAIGAGQNRNVAVVDLPFEGPPVSEAADGGMWRKNRWITIAQQNAVLATALLLLLLGGLRPLLRWLDAGLAAAGNGAGRSDRMRAFGVQALRAAGSVGAGVADTTAAAARRPHLAPNPDPEAVRALVLNEPGRAAQVIKEWIASDRSRFKQAS